MFWFSDKSPLRTFVLFSFLPSYSSLNVIYRKIEKISPESYIFQRLFWGAYFWTGLYSEGLMYGEKFAFQNRLGLAYSWKEIDRFCFVLLCIWEQFPSTSPRGAYFRRGDFTEGFLCYEFGGGAYTWRGLFSEIYGSFSMGFKYGRIPAVSKAHLLEFWMKYFIHYYLIYYGQFFS